MGLIDLSEFRNAGNTDCEALAELAASTPVTFTDSATEFPPRSAGGVGYIVSTADAITEIGETHRYVVVDSDGCLRIREQGDVIWPSYWTDQIAPWYVGVEKRTDVGGACGIVQDEYTANKIDIPVFSVDVRLFIAVSVVFHPDYDPTDLCQFKVRYVDSAGENDLCGFIDLRNVQGQTFVGGFFNTTRLVYAGETKAYVEIVAKMTPGYIIASLDVYAMAA